MVGKELRYTKEYAGWYEDLKRDFIDQYFHGDVELWKGRTQPFISFRHLFFRVLKKHTGHTNSDLGRLEGLDRQTIGNSLNTSSINVHPIMEQSINEFLIGRMSKDPLTRVRLTLQAESGTIDEVAEKYGVHFTVIEKIMNHKPVASNTITYLHRQCHV